MLGEVCPIAQGHSRQVEKRIGHNHKGDRMLTAVRQRLSYSNVIATMALFIALGGVAVAAGLPKNSVAPKQLKRGAVTAAKIRKHAVPSAKLGPSSVLAAAIKNGVITTNKLNNEAVTTPKLANESVSTAKLGKGSVTAAKLSDEIGPLLATLKPGQTLRGVFDVGGEARTAVSYQFPMVNAAAVTVLKKGETSANCSGLGGGNLQTPQATPGNLCIYTTEESGTPALTAENNTRLGFGLKTAGTTGDFAYGQWAVTAP